MGCASEYRSSTDTQTTSGKQQALTLSRATPLRDAAGHQELCDFACVREAEAPSHGGLCHLMPFCFSIIVRAAVVSVSKNVASSKQPIVHNSEMLSAFITFLFEEKVSSAQVSEMLS